MQYENRVTISVNLPKPLYDKLREIYEKEGYMNFSDFLRTVFRWYVWHYEKHRREPQPETGR